MISSRIAAAASGDPIEADRVWILLILEHWLKAWDAKL